MVESVPANRRGRPILGRVAISVGYPHNAQVLVTKSSTCGPTAGVSCGCATPNPQSRELHRRSRQLDAVLGPALAANPTPRERRPQRRTVHNIVCVNLAVQTSLAARMGSRCISHREYERVE